jgi:hypothetical protein
VSHRAPSINQPTMRPAFSTFFANVAFSERKPYPVMGNNQTSVRSQYRVATIPGCIIWTPCSRAILMISSPAK